jgi:two-component system, chemotaxis family, chemotaxis protein CheY
MDNPGGCVCIVDDDDDIREALRFVIEMEGLRVIEAADGAAALQCIREQAVPCALILLDLMMPGMNGWEFRSRQMQDPALASIPVFILSGARDAPQHTRDLQVEGYFEKPLDLALLAKVLDRYR